LARPPFDPRLEVIGADDRLLTVRIEQESLVEVLVVHLVPQPAVVLSRSRGRGPGESADAAPAAGQRATSKLHQPPPDLHPRRGRGGIEQRIRTEPERFGAVLGTRSRARRVPEASTDSEWVARCLEALGHEGIVADPNFAPMYATRTRKVKTDRRDARALA